MKRKRKPGGGRKPAPYKTTTVSVRVRTEWVEPVKEAITNTINNLKSQTMKAKLQIVHESDRVHVSENGTPITTHTWGFSGDPSKDECIAEAKKDLQAYAAKAKSEGFTVELMPDRYN